MKSFYPFIFGSLVLLLAASGFAQKSEAVKEFKAPEESKTAQPIVGPEKPAAGNEEAAFTVHGIAVLDLELQGVAESATKALSDLFRSELMQTKRFEVMERGKMDEIMKEQGFQQSGACTDDACMVEIGQLLGVDGMVAGSIGKLGKLTLINMRKINMMTGKIDKTITHECKCQEENLPLAIKIAARKMAGLNVDKETAQLEKEMKIATAENKKDEQEKRDADAKAQAKAQKKGIGAGVIAAGALLVGGAGAGAYFLLSGDDTTSTPAGPPADPTLPGPPIPAN